MEKAYSSDADGTGIGLYLVKQFMNQYDGVVRIKDNTPRGAVVKLGFVPAST
jgi:sensor histidine kinase regulating citrate/malate metabolism